MVQSTKRSRVPGLPARSHRVASMLLEGAGIESQIEGAELLGIGSAGLSVRGNRDEDGTHTRLHMSDGTTLVYREYSTTTRGSDFYLEKERNVMRALGEAGLPTPDDLAAIGSGPGTADPAALLLSDNGGQPLEEVFRSIVDNEKPDLWSAVGSNLRRLHEVEIDRLSFLRNPEYQRPWVDFLAYFLKSLRNVKKARPDLAKDIDDLVSLKTGLKVFLQHQPRAICLAGGGYMPGMMMKRNGTWSCANWLSLGYYVSINDPTRDVVSLQTAIREWTGEDIPKEFYDSYGSRPDEISKILYSFQLSRGVAYENPNSGVMRKGFGPPPYSTATRSLEELPQTVERLRSLLDSAGITTLG